MFGFLKRLFLTNESVGEPTDIPDSVYKDAYSLSIENDLRIANESATIVDTSNKLSTVIYRIQVGQEAALRLQQYENQGIYKGKDKVSDYIDVFFNLKEAIIHNALKRAMSDMLIAAENLKTAQGKIKRYEKFIEEINSFHDEYSENNHVYVQYIEHEIRSKIEALALSSSNIELLAQKSNSNPVEKSFDWNDYEKTEFYFLEKVNLNASNPYELHFAYNGLIKLYYKNIRYRPDATEKLIHFCKKDIGLFPKFRDAWFDQNPDYDFLPRIPSFQRLIQVYEREGRLHEAIDVCLLAIECGLNDGTKAGFEGRLTKLQNKLMKTYIASTSQDEN